MPKTRNHKISSHSRYLHAKWNLFSLIYRLERTEIKDLTLSTFSKNYSTVMYKLFVDERVFVTIQRTSKCCFLMLYSNGALRTFRSVKAVEEEIINFFKNEQDTYLDMYLQKKLYLRRN